MFGTTSATSSFAVDDVERAAQFYRETLGLRVSEDGGLLTLHTAGDVLVYPKDDHVPATFTVLNSSVDDVPAAAEALEARGVQVLRYTGTATDTDERGVFRYGPITQAWFTDPAGNVLSVIHSD